METVNFASRVLFELSLPRVGVCSGVGAYYVAFASGGVGDLLAMWAKIAIDFQMNSR